MTIDERKEVILKGEAVKSHQLRMALALPSSSAWHFHLMKPQLLGAGVELQEKVSIPVLLL